MCSSLQKIQVNSISQENKQTNKPTYLEKNTNRLDPNIQVLQLLTFKLVKQQKQTEDLSARELVHASPAPFHLLAGKLTILRVADPTGGPARPTKITLLSIFRGTTARLQLNMKNSHLTSFATSHKPKEPPTRPLFQAVASSAFSMKIIKITEGNSHLSK